MTLSIAIAPRRRLIDRIAPERDFDTTTQAWGNGAGWGIAVIFGVMVWTAVICAVV